MQRYRKLGVAAQKRSSTFHGARARKLGTSVSSLREAAQDPENDQSYLSN